MIIFKFFMISNMFWLKNKKNTIDSFGISSKIYYLCNQILKRKEIEEQKDIII